MAIILPLWVSWRCPWYLCWMRDTLEKSTPGCPGRPRPLSVSTGIYEMIGHFKPWANIRVRILINMTIEVLHVARLQLQYSTVTLPGYGSTPLEIKMAFNFWFSAYFYILWMPYWKPLLLIGSWKLFERQEINLCTFATACNLRMSYKMISKKFC